MRLRLPLATWLLKQDKSASFLSRKDFDLFVHSCSTVNVHVTIPAAKDLRLKTLVDTQHTTAAFRLTPRACDLAKGRQVQLERHCGWAQCQQVKVNDQAYTQLT